MCDLLKRVIFTRSILSTPACDVYVRLKATGAAIKIARRATLLTISKINIIRWNMYRDNNFHSRRQVWNRILQKASNSATPFGTSTIYWVLTMWTLEITSVQITRRNWNLRTLPHHLLKCVISTLISRLATRHLSVSASTRRLSSYGQQHFRQSSLRCLYISTDAIC